MPLHDRPWILKRVDDESVVANLQVALNDLPHALARALVLRGVTTLDGARTFFRGTLADLHDPFVMADMAVAAARLAAAVRDRERVLVYGDYDVDGTTATALVTHFLRGRGVPAAFFIPDRLKHGYGLSRRGLDHARESGATLVIALDCGVTAHDEAEYAARLGIDLVVCDHHTVPDTLPRAVAVLDPKRSDCAYPFRELCGCGVAFKLVQAVLAELGSDPAEALQYLDLVALATASDVVPVVGENRILLRAGLDRLRTDSRLGIRALAEEARVTLSDLNMRSILFGLGPRINAAGRLGDARRSVRLLLTDQPHEAAARARQLERVNAERRALDRSTAEAAAERAERQISEGRRALVLHDPAWHLGVVGIVASRLVERFQVPTILLTTVGDVAKGSARSIDGINVYEAISACGDLLAAFGGHDYAAGLSLPPGSIDAFRDRFETAVGAVTAPERPPVGADAELDLNDVDERFWAVLSQFGPHGPGNEHPVFLSRNLQPADRAMVVGRDQAHLKFAVRLEGGRRFDAIAFGQADRLPVVDASGPIDLLFSLDENVWNGVRSLQLNVVSIRSAA